MIGSLKSVPKSWTKWPATIYALPGPFSKWTIELDVISELDNEPIGLKIEFMDRLPRVHNRFRAAWTNYETWMAGNPDEKEQWLTELQKTLSGASDRLAEQMVSLVFGPPELVRDIILVASGWYPLPLSDASGKPK